jgi:hypothetical protein
VGRHWTLFNWQLTNFVELKRKKKNIENENVKLEFFFFFSDLCKDKGPCEAGWLWSIAAPRSRLPRLQSHCISKGEKKKVRRKKKGKEIGNK